jgi:hypothetical protein
LVLELNYSTTIAFGTVTGTEITVIVDRTINTVIIILESEEVFPTTQAFLGFSVGHGLVVSLVILVKVIEGNSD